MTDHGRQLIVTGPLGCTEGERADLRVTVTQRTTGAVAEGDATPRFRQNEDQIE